jgi:hypothetical protein
MAGRVVCGGAGGACRFAATAARRRRRGRRPLCVCVRRPPNLPAQPPALAARAGRRALFKRSHSRAASWAKLRPHSGGGAGPVEREERPGGEGRVKRPAGGRRRRRPTAAAAAGPRPSAARGPPFMLAPAPAAGRLPTATCRPAAAGDEPATRLPPRAAALAASLPCAPACSRPQSAHRAFSRRRRSTAPSLLLSLILSHAVYPPIQPPQTKYRRVPGPHRVRRRRDRRPGRPARGRGGGGRAGRSERRGRVGCLARHCHPAGDHPAGRQPAGGVRGPPGRL